MTWCKQGSRLKNKIIINSFFLNSGRIHQHLFRQSQHSREERWKGRFQSNKRGRKLSTVFRNTCNTIISKTQLITYMKEWMNEWMNGAVAKSYMTIASSYMSKYFRISSYIRSPSSYITLCWISLYMRKIWFSFLSVQCWQAFGQNAHPCKVAVNIYLYFHLLISVCPKTIQVYIYGDENIWKDLSSLWRLTNSWDAFHFPHHPPHTCTYSW